MIFLFLIVTLLCSQSNKCEQFDLTRPISSIAVGDKVFLHPTLYEWQGEGNNFIVEGETVPGGIIATVVLVETIPEARRVLYGGNSLWVELAPHPQIELAKLNRRQNIEELRKGLNPLCFTAPRDSNNSYTIATSDLSRMRLLKK